MYQDDATGSATSVRYILFQELCPALMAIMKDGLKPEVITIRAGPKLMEEFIKNRSIEARCVVLIH